MSLAIAYYNEIEPYAAQWLRNLIAAGHIAPGDVDERSIEDVHPDDLKPYTQCHFFAGVGVWSLALRSAGWPDDRPVWTGSCPCQPFSSAGEGLGFDDDRHLWPDFAWHIRERSPGVIFGEQVASKDAEPWLDVVQADLEAMEYAFGAVAFPAAGVGAPHIRDRTYWLANHHGHGRHKAPRGRVHDQEHHFESRGGACRLEYPDGPGPQGRPRGTTPEGTRTALSGGAGRLANSQRWHAAEPAGQRARPGNPKGPGAPGQLEGRSALLDPRPAGPVNGLWADADWLFCRDGKWRPVEPGTFPLAHGAPARVGRLRAYGNALNFEAATQFVASAMEVIG
ncbi:DNA cytosine methyltransferase [Pseudomonas sp. NY15366]